MATGQIGNTVTLTCGTSDFVCKLLDFSLPTVIRASIGTTNMTSVGSTDTSNIYQQYEPGSVDMGSISGTLAFDPEAFDPDNFPGDATEAAYAVTAAETMTLTWPDASTFACSGFFTEFGISEVIDGHVTASFTIKLSGKPTSI